MGDYIKREVALKIWQVAFMSFLWRRNLAHRDTFEFVIDLNILAVTSVSDARMPGTLVLWSTSRARVCLVVCAYARTQMRASACLCV